MTVKVIVKVTVKVKDLCAVERMLPRILLREKTIVHVKQKNYFRILFVNFIICFCLLNIIDLFIAVIEFKLNYYFSWPRVFESLVEVIIYSISFTIVVVIIHRKKK